MICKTTKVTPIGTITLACEGNTLVGLWLEGQKYHGATIKEAITENNDEPVFDKITKWLERYFNGQKPDIKELNLAPKGSEFRQEVWRILCEIPYGEVITYGGIAKKMAKKMNKDSISSQAVGGAVGHNPISIIIPCHRVVGASGSLTGYAGGIITKIKLLELENVDMTKYFFPNKGSAL